MLLSSPVGIDNQALLTLAGQSDVTTQTFLGLQLQKTPYGYFYVAKYMGDENAPADVRRLRRSIYGLMRRMGRPVLIKKLLTDLDASKGLAQRSANFDDIYGRTRLEDPLSWGTGFVSTQLSPNEWIAPDGTIITAAMKPNAAYVEAPLYRGYGPGFITYVIEPDRPVDVYKEDPVGALIHTQQAEAQTAWWPYIGDNDLIINITLDNEGKIIDTGTRYQAKLVQPITIRGVDERGRAEKYSLFGNAHTVNQQFEMSALPPTHTLYRVEIDR